MSREVIRQVVAVAGAGAVAVALLVTPAIAAAAPPAKAGAVAPVAAPRLGEEDATKPTTVKIASEKLAADLTVTEQAESMLFQDLIEQVTWLSTLPGQIGAPAEDKRGPKYTLTVLAGATPQQTYELYPSAEGGPRVYRPSEQPKGKVNDGWFYGRVTMSEDLRHCGAPLVPSSELLVGGEGGGGKMDGPQLTNPDVNLPEVLGELKQLVLLNGVVVLAIAVGLAGMSWVIRRRI